MQIRDFIKFLCSDWLKPKSTFHILVATIKKYGENHIPAQCMTFWLFRQKVLGVNSMIYIWFYNSVLITIQMMHCSAMRFQ